MNVWQLFYESFDDAAKVAEMARKQAERRLKQRQKISAAQRKRVDAAQKYQASLKSAQESENAAKSTLATLS